VIDEGIDDIETLRLQMKKVLNKNQKAQQLAASQNAKQNKSEEGMTKIDKITGDFLAFTQTIPESTKLAALESRAIEGVFQ
jgi:hypothetical protein